MKHYVEVVNSTLTESVLRNVNLQANANFVDELIGELNAENESLKKQIQEMGEDIQKVLKEKDDVLGKKQSEIDELTRGKHEVDNVKHQLYHLDTFRNQLVVANKTIEEKSAEIEELKKKIDDLQAPPKKKKTLGLPKTIETFMDTEVTTDSSVRDGGTF
jgi:polyhydroxyalkanoate synthesis regulator phasin